MPDDELLDGEERHSDDTPLTIIDDELVDDVMPPLEETEDGVYKDTDGEDEDELDVDPELVESEYI